MIIMLGGPTMNLLIFLLITILLYGLIGAQGADHHGRFGQRVRGAGHRHRRRPARPPTSADYRKAPANGVLQAGDKITAIDGTPIKNWADAVDDHRGARPNKRSPSTVRRAGQAGRAAAHAGAEHQVRQRHRHRDQAGRLHRHQHHRRPTRRSAPGQLRTVIWQQLTLSVDALKQFPSKIGSLFGTVFEGKPRDQAGAVGVVGLGRIGGEIADSSKVATLDKISMLLGLLASVNLLLFFFNLLPLLPLDGGHVAGAIVEAVRRGLRAAAQAAPADLRRRRPAGAGDVRGGRRPDRVLGAGDVRRYRQADHPAPDPAYGARI